MTNCPESLKPTVDLLRLAFPDGVDCDDVASLMRVFYDHMCDENLAKVFACWLGLDEFVLVNEVYRSALLSESDARVIAFKSILETKGFPEWLKSD